ncbi:hypothetical protein GCM10009119_30360 [Algoriphagus jejuensis]|uniref:3-keto-alpha-glucoside-1,2-lyase/3-keto-2-hydroxy-glucal hydratase domain-containing protein n=1 Tax=Algoriphagus jejuensis TaxID=419934 RepID=A0ABP3YFD9_9BACT
MNSRIFSLSLALILLSGISFAQDNALSKKEKKDGWKLLFNGENFEGWTSPKGDSPDSVWKIEDGVFSLQKKNNDKRMNIITTDKYGDFELVVDFKLTEAANSGIKYFYNNHDQSVELGLEYQIIDNDRHPDAKDENRRLAALYDMFEVSTVEKVNVGEWNHIRIVSKGSTVTHYLNGVEVLSFDRKSDAFETARAASKYSKAKPLFGSFDTGHILIQDHSDIVYFKNVKIKAN